MCICWWMNCVNIRMHGATIKKKWITSLDFFTIPPSSLPGRMSISDILNPCAHLNKEYYNKPTRCSCSQLVQTWPRWKKVAATIIWPVPEAVDTVFYTPDDGCGKHPKHVEWPCSEIKLTANNCILLVYYNIDYDARNHKRKIPQQRMEP